MKVPFFNVGLQNSLIIDQLLPAIEAVLKRGDFVLGREVETFEEAFATRCESRFAVGVNSCTDALILTMKSLGVGRDDEVLTVPNSYYATTAAIELVGATPVFVDVGLDENIDPALIEEKLTAKTKAIVPVHWTGRPAQMSAIVEIARKTGLLIVEDCAQAIGARYRGKHVGTFGSAGCFSFHPIKNLGGCGDGGMVLTDDEGLYNDLKVARNHGKRGYGDCSYWSYNSRLDTIQAAVLNVKLNYISSWTERRREIARFYIEHLAELPLHLPCEGLDEYCVYFTFTIQTDLRDDLQEFLARQGIGTGILYPVPLHLQTAAQNLGYRLGDFPMAEKESWRILSLPIYPELTDEQVRYVPEMIHKFFECNKA